ncbi:hypothetical protein SAMN05216379_103124 [Nitrosomonas eutropha]|nr:hypothetical protein SAMN05216379_103124 [Nitrosomonas eutropha]
MSGQQNADGQIILMIAKLAQESLQVHENSLTVQTKFQK